MEKNSNNDDIVYFYICDWYDYTGADPLEQWVIDNKFGNEDWVKENKLCVILVPYVMEIYYFVTAKREWVKKNCPCILDKKYHMTRTPDENGKVLDPTCDEYLTYSEENIGISIRNGYLKIN